MIKEKYMQHTFAKGETVLFRGEPATVVATLQRPRSWNRLVVSFEGPGRTRNFAAVCYEDIELPTPPDKTEDR